MKKKGFTLVELLAVIAILAILVIIALPNIMSLFNEAKKNSFTNEVKEIAKSAENQWITDSMINTEEIAYCRIEKVECSKSLRLSGRQEIDYYIKVNKAGKIVEYSASDGTYQYSYAGNGLKIEEIDNIQQIALLSENDIITITSSGVSGGSGSSSSGIATFVNRQREGLITKGDELIISEEAFYVVSSNSSETVLLTKYDLNKTTKLQDTSGAAGNLYRPTFVGSSYWYDRNAGLISPYDNESNPVGSTTLVSVYPYVYDSHCNFYTTVNSYANKIATNTGVSVTGRAMTYEEAISLDATIRSDKNSHYYWLGSASRLQDAWVVNSSGDLIGNMAGSIGVRPVIIISTSAL